MKDTSEKVSLWETVPFLGKHVRAYPKDEESSLWCLEVPRTRWEWFYGILLKLGRSSCRLDLDAMGSRAVSHVGSGMTLGEILSDLLAAFPDETQLSERLSVFVMQLHKKGVLVLARKV